jgi:hypothetical protein
MRHTLRHHDADSSILIQHEAACQAMRVLAHAEASVDERKEAVGALLVHLCGMSVAQVCEEGIQRLSRLWLERPPRVSWHEDAITSERVEGWLRISARRSQGAVRRLDERTQRMLSADDLDERARAMRATSSSLLTSRHVRDSTQALIQEVTGIAEGLIARHTTRRDQRGNLQRAFERLCELNLSCSFEAWLARKHPHLKEASQKRLLRDRYHQQHTRARRFFHMALLAEPELEMSALAQRFFSMI